MSARKVEILVVEDDPATATLMRRIMEMHNYTVESAPDGHSALEWFKFDEPDLVLLDVGLPGVDGFEVCRRMRESTSVPIIMVTGRGADDDIVRGLDSGANDYVVKPFSAVVLAARVRAVLRHTRSGARASHRRFRCGDLLVDFGSYRVFRGNEVFHLTPTESRILTMLVRRKGHIVTSSEILTRVWGDGYSRETAILRTHVGRLRRKIEPSLRTPLHLRTKPSVGYYLDCPHTDD